MQGGPVPDTIMLWTATGLLLAIVAIVAAKLVEVL